MQNREAVVAGLDVATEASEAIPGVDFEPERVWAIFACEVIYIRFKLIRLNVAVFFGAGIFELAG